VHEQAAAIFLVLGEQQAVIELFPYVGARGHRCRFAFQQMVAE